MKKNQKVMIAGAVALMLIMISLLNVISYAVSNSVIDETKTEATLSIYKYEVADLNDYQTAGTGETVEAITPNKDTTKPLQNVQFSIYKVADDTTSTVAPEGEATATGTTDANGKVTFTIAKANFGRYLVVETSAPENVKEKTANFLVDVPMTSTDGTKWIYDISVYPKNQTVYGSVVLNKVDEDNLPLQGAKFDLYKKDATEARVTNLTTNAYGQIIVENLPFGEYYFIETAAPEGFLVDNKTKYNFSINASGEVAYDAENTDKAVSVDSENGVRVLTVTNSKSLTIKKEVDKNTQNAMENVKWTITTDVPSDIDTNYHSYVIKDKLVDGLTYNNDIVVKIGNQTLTKDTDYTVTVSGNDITIELLPNGANVTEGTLTVEYTTKLDEEVFNKLGQDLGDEAKLEYTLETDKTGETYNTHTATITTIPKVHVGSYWFTKIEKGTTTKLTGAKFKIATSEENAKAGTYITLHNAEGDEVTEFVSDSNGLVKIEGIAYGTYYLVETEAPDGFNLLKQPKEFIVSGASTASEGNVENSKGLQLPFTGGTGITFIVVIGIALIAIGIFATRKSKKDQENN